MLIITPSALTDASILSKFKTIVWTSNLVIGILLNQGVCSFLICDLKEWTDSLLLILIVMTCCCCHLRKVVTAPNLSREIGFLTRIN